MIIIKISTHAFNTLLSCCWNPLSDIVVGNENPQNRGIHFLHVCTSILQFQKRKLATGIAKINKY